MAGGRQDNMTNRDRQRTLDGGKVPVSTRTLELRSEIQGRDVGGETGKCSIPDVGQSVVHLWTRQNAQAAGPQ